ncbi:MAG: hypothetical protein H7126_12105 [Candidatus Parcubacteria bacterium]|nr:hypothetical protein [Leptolyngbyaceae cyanobacterium LF-bin-113]
MSSSPFRNILLPAVLVSGTVFSVLLTTFIAHQPRPKAIDESISETGGTQYLSPKERKDTLIRYAGFSVIVSVGVGFATIEGLRKWRYFWESPQDKAEQFGLERILQEDFELAPLELESAMSYASVQFSDRPERSLTPEAFASVEAESSKETDIQFLVREDFQLQKLANSAIAPVLEQPLLNDADHSEAPQILHQSAVQEQLAFPVLDLHRQTQTCRIKVPYSQQVRFACLFEDRYYRFVKAEKTKDQALKVATLLAQKDDRPIITAIKQGYAVWTWEPEAIVEPTA